MYMMDEVPEYARQSGEIATHVGHTMPVTLADIIAQYVGGRSSEHLEWLLDQDDDELDDLVDLLSIDHGSTVDDTDVWQDAIVETFDELPVNLPSFEYAQSSGSISTMIDLLRDIKGSNTRMERINLVYVLIVLLEDMWAAELSEDD
jgi:hypothetical protein